MQFEAYLQKTSHPELFQDVISCMPNSKGETANAEKAFDVLVSVAKLITSHLWPATSAEPKRRVVIDTYLHVSRSLLFCFLYTLLYF